MKILPNWNVLFNFKAFLLFRYFAEYFYLLTKEGYIFFFIKNLSITVVLKLKG